MKQTNTILLLSLVIFTSGILGAVYYAAIGDSIFSIQYLIIAVLAMFAHINTRNL